MPYDGGAYVPLTETKADPFSLESLVAWLERQDPAEVYCYGDAGRCLAAQFNLECGRKYIPPGTTVGYWAARAVFNKSDTKVYSQTGDFVGELEAIAVSGGTSFGSALHRARTLLAARAGI